MNNNVRHLVKYLLGALFIRNLYWLRQLAVNDISLSSFPYLRSDKGDLVILGTPLRFTRSDSSMILLHTPLLRKFAQVANVRLARRDNSNFIEAEGIIVELKEAGDVDQIDETIICHWKQCTLPDNCIVWDIGGNVGITALWYAAQPAVEAIYVNEPFPQTVARMERNLALNPALAKKITVLPYGIESEDGEATLNYSPQGSEGMGIYSDWVSEHDPGVVSQTIQLRSAGSVLRDIRSRHPNHPIIIKLDCEGSERTIIPSLTEHADLSNVPIITMETHGDVQGDLTRALESAGYVVFCFQHRSNPCGEIHASRRMLPNDSAC